MPCKAGMKDMYIIERGMGVKMLSEKEELQRILLKLQEREAFVISRLKESPDGRLLRTKNNGKDVFFIVRSLEDGRRDRKVCSDEAMISALIGKAYQIGRAHV